MADTIARALAVALGGQGGGEPEAYLKSASVNGNTLTLNNKDDTLVIFTPDGEPELYLKNASVSGETLTLTKQDNTSVTFSNSGKQDTLTAGSNITISGNTISAADTKYTPIQPLYVDTGELRINLGNGVRVLDNLLEVKPGTGITVNASGTNVDTSVIQEKLTAGSNISINNNTISATDTTYSAGTGISISNNVISATSAGPIVLELDCASETTTQDIKDKLSLYYNNPDDYILRIKYFENNYTEPCECRISNDGSNNGQIDVRVMIREGTYIKGFNGTVVSGVCTNVDWGYETMIQKALTAGDNITIDNTTISATVPAYTAGTGITIADLSTNYTMLDGSYEGTGSGEWYSTVSGSSAVYSKLVAGNTYTVTVTAGGTDTTGTIAVSSGGKPYFDIAGSVTSLIGTSCYYDGGSDILLTIPSGTTVTKMVITAPNGNKQVSYSATPLWATYDSTTGTLALSTTAPV